MVLYIASSLSLSLRPFVYYCISKLLMNFSLIREIDIRMVERGIDLLFSLLSFSYKYIMGSITYRDTQYTILTVCFRQKTLLAAVCGCVCLFV